MDDRSVAVHTPSDPAGSGSDGQLPVAVVTGAGGGIGRATAVRLAARPMRVVVVGRTASTLAESAALVERETRGTGVVHVADVTDEDAVSTLFSMMQDRWGRVDVLVHCAGISGPVKPAWQQELAEWDETLRSNVTSAFLCSRAAARLMSTQRRGAIVLVGSITGKRPLAERWPYATSKAALIGLTRTLALELGPFGVTVNLVSPGAVDTDRLAHLAAASGVTHEALCEQFAALTATRRLSRAEDVADAIHYLSSASNVTGVDLNVDGGLWYS